MSSKACVRACMQGQEEEVHATPPPPPPAPPGPASRQKKVPARRACPPCDLSSMMCRKTPLVVFSRSSKQQKRRRPPSVRLSVRPSVRACVRACGKQVAKSQRTKRRGVSSYACVACHGDSTGHAVGARGERRVGRAAGVVRCCCRSPGGRTTGTLRLIEQGAQGAASGRDHRARREELALLERMRLHARHGMVQLAVVRLEEQFHWDLVSTPCQPPRTRSRDGTYCPASNCRARIGRQCRRSSRSRGPSSRCR